jgi:hypothetical protein
LLNVGRRSFARTSPTRRLSCGITSEATFRRSSADRSPSVDTSATFLCYHPRLVIELDGGDHDADHDRVRDAWLRSQGFEILRFSNYEMKYETEAVLEAIYLAAASPSESSSSLSGGGGARQGDGGGQKP